MLLSVRPSQVPAETLAAAQRHDNLTHSRHLQTMTLLNLTKRQKQPSHPRLSRQAVITQRRSVPVWPVVGNVANLER